MPKQSIVDNELQIAFESMPSASNRNALKNAGFKWNHREKYWSAPFDETYKLLVDVGISELP